MHVNEKEDEGRKREREKGKEGDCNDFIKAT